MKAILANSIFPSLILSALYVLFYNPMLPLAEAKLAIFIFLLATLSYTGFSFAILRRQNEKQTRQFLGVQTILQKSVFLSLGVMSIFFILQIYISVWAVLCFGCLYFLAFYGFQFTNTKKLLKAKTNRKQVLIYGAGQAGMQLLAALESSPEIQAVAFIDDNTLKHKREIFGLAVFSSNQIAHIVKTKNIDEIMIAIPSLSSNKLDELVERLKHLPCTTQVMPQDVDVMNKNRIVENFVSVSPDDLLGRKKQNFTMEGLSSMYADKTILITGAGGSIGLELCRQTFKHSPGTIVLYERSELALYNAEQQLSEMAQKLGITLVFILGDVCDPVHLKHVFETYHVQIVFHAAAYKHVSLIEKNEILGVKNNVIGTRAIAQQSLESEVDSFILISSDKAVRPASVMGATKRLAEIVVQDFDTRNSKTKFSIVRFGNVLGSSGSVVPLFKRQITNGGPITLTHDDVTRYFMAISEAAELVIESGGLAKGGDVFVLDMGPPVKIKDLALNLIEKSNLTLKDEGNPEGDIEIVITGLRPGEKLFEELLINTHPLQPVHPKITRVIEPRLSNNEVVEMLENIDQAVLANDIERVRALIINWVE